MLMGLGKEINESFSRLDYAGITLSIWATSISLILLLLPNPPHSVLNMDKQPYALWAIGLSTIVSSISFVTTLQPIQDKRLRVGIYCLSASSAFVPLLIQRENPRTHVYIQHTLSKMMIWFLLGLFFYFSRFPERIYPGRFDRLFHSHNFWHCFVWLASYEHFNGLQVMAAQ